MGEFMIKIIRAKTRCTEVVFTDPRDEFEELGIEFQNEYIARIFADMLAASEQFKGEEIKVENK
jgi:hypothetical protein